MKCVGRLIFLVNNNNSTYVALVFYVKL